MSTAKTVWQEGMLLRPQHFQQSDRYYAHQLNVRSQLSGPYSSGFFNLELDTSHLLRHKILVSTAAGILPDGSYFELSNDQEGLIFDIPPNAYDLPIYLGLPLVGGNRVETRKPAQTDALARYISHDLEVTDSNAGTHSTNTLSCARQDLRLLVGDSQSDSAFIKLKVCHIKGTDNNTQIVLDPNFTPSYLHFHASKELMACVEQILNQLKSRAEAIADRMRSTGQIGGAELGDFMMLQLINRSELLLQHYLAINQIHPEQIFRSVLTLLGDLSAFSSERRPNTAQFYNHQNQLGCFLKLKDAINQILSLVLEQHAVELPLEQHKYGVQVARLEDPSFLQSGYFVLVANAQCEMNELRQRLPQQLKIGTVNNIRDLVNLHLPGIKLSPLPVAPRQIPYHTQKSYFKLELAPQNITELESSHGFAFHLSGEFTALDLQFWAIRN